MSVCYNSKHLEQFVKDSEFAALYPQVETAHRLLETKTGPGNRSEEHTSELQSRP